MRISRSGLVTLATMAALALHGAADAQSADNSDLDRPAPFNYGFGNGVRVPDGQMSIWNRLARAFGPQTQTPFQAQRAIETLPHSLVAPPASGGPTAGVNGLFGPVLPWPIIPLHMALLPDGRVLNYGTDQNGKQGAAMFYDIWDPSQPYETSQTVLPNTTATDIFCSGMGLLPNGTLLITGGDLTVSGKRNYSNANVNIFTPPTNTLAANGVMNYARWYPSDMPLPNGDHFIVGGRSSQLPTAPVLVPEYYSVANNSFTALTGATLSSKLSWYYPKVFVTSGGTILDVDQSGALASLSTAGNGGFATLPARVDNGLYDLPTVMYSPGKLLSIRKDNYIGSNEEDYTVDNIDATGASPVMTRVASVPGQGREWANMTVLADGTVFVNGGSGTQNALKMVSYLSYLYNPATGAWTQGGTAAQPRLYHSASLLLPDGTVLTGGGGAPGPVNELNAEIYYPPYLFTQDGTGNFATRPVIAAAPPTVARGSTFDLTMGDNSQVSAVNLIRLGAVSHSTSLQTRFIPASFVQNGTDVTVTTPSNTNDFLTGYWMVFVVNASGVPSVSSIVDVPDAD